MYENIRAIPTAIQTLKNSLTKYYESFQGINIKSTVSYSQFNTEEHSWTYIYKYDEEQGFKVNHDGEHYYMTEEDMWCILENAIEVVKTTNKLMEDIVIGERIEHRAQPLTVIDFYEVNGEGRGIVATDYAGNEVRFAQSCGTYVRVLTTIQVDSKQ